MNDKLKIIIVDDNSSFTEGIKFFIENILKYQVINLHKNGKEFLDSTNSDDADIILMDIEMPECNGFEAAKLALWKNKNLKIVAITSFEDEIYITKLVYAGFRGFIVKDKVHDELEKAIQTVLNGNLHLPENIKINK